jgi:hypothetical protein
MTIYSIYAVVVISYAIVVKNHNKGSQILINSVDTEVWAALVAVFTIQAIAGICRI